MGSGGGNWGAREMSKERRNLISGGRPLLVSPYIKMPVAFYLHLALCFSQCL